MPDFDDLQEASNKLSALILNEMEKEIYDVRVVALACSKITGSFLFGLEDKALKYELTKSYCETMIKYAEVPLAITNTN